MINTRADAMSVIFPNNYDNMLEIHNPILTNTDLLKIKNMKIKGFKVAVIPITYYVNTRLDRAIEHMFVETDRAYRDGANILILSDRGVDENHERRCGLCP